MSDRKHLSFGIQTAPMNTTYEGILSVWQEADATPEIEHAWLWDHMMPLLDDPAGEVLEGWTLLSALAAQTERLRLGLLVTANLIRPPAVLAKMATTTDVISRGRLEFGIGVGATDLPDRPHQELPVREYNAYGLDLVPPAEGIARLDEACTIFKRMCTEEVFDFDGQYYQLTGTFCEPKPVQRPHPPIMIGGMGDRTLRVVAEHADIWNTPGPPWSSLEEIRHRSSVLDEHCAALGRDRQEITRSALLFARREDTVQIRQNLVDVIEAGITHLILGLFPPHTPDLIPWLTEEIIAPVRDKVTVS